MLFFWTTPFPVSCAVRLKNSFKEIMVYSFYIIPSNYQSRLLYEITDRVVMSFKNKNLFFVLTAMTKTTICIYVQNPS